MNARDILCACMAGLVAASQCLWAQDDPRKTRFPPELTDSTLREGVWIWRSGHILPERQIQKVVRIRKSDGKWDRTMFTLSHKGSDDGPVLIFRRHFMQPTYTPADDSIKKQIPERMEREPHKPDARDG